MYPSGPTSSSNAQIVVKEQVPPSPFFTKLPLEIRLQIYRCVIESWDWSDSLHIISAPGDEPHLTHCLCRLEDMIQGRPIDEMERWAAGLIEDGLGCEFYWPDWPQHMFLHVDWRRMYHCGTGPIAPAAGYINFLLTCRQIYNEGIGMLYSSFQFNVMDVRTAYRFLRNVPAQGLSQIRGLRVSCLMEGQEPKDLEYTYNSTWTEICEIISSMSLLKDLRISLHGCPQGWERTMLEPLMKADMPNTKFLAVLPFARNRDEADAACKSGYEQSSLVIKRKDKRYEPSNTYAHGVQYGHPSRRRWPTWCKICCCPCLCLIGTSSLIAELALDATKMAVRKVRKHFLWRNRA